MSKLDLMTPHVHIFPKLRCMDSAKDWRCRFGKDSFTSIVIVKNRNGCIEMKIGGGGGGG